MVRIPPGFHRQAARPGPTQAWRPGWRGTGAQRMAVVPVGAYRGKITSVPLTGGQAQVVIGAGHTGQVVVGPQGLGTVWYPVQATVQTTSGVLDTSTFNLYLGSQGVPVTLVGTLYPGGTGTIALAIPSMTPGQYLIGIWTGAKAADTASVNVIGTMDALTTAAGGQ